MALRHAAVYTSGAKRVRVSGYDPDPTVLEDRHAANYTTPHSQDCTLSASYGFRSHLLRSTGGCPRQLTHEARRQFARRLRRHLFRATRGRGRPDEPGSACSRRESSALRFLFTKRHARAAGETASSCLASCPQGTCPATRPQLEKWITPVTIRALPLFTRPLSPEQLAIHSDAPGLRSPQSQGENLTAAPAARAP